MSKSVIQTKMQMYEVDIRDKPRLTGAYSGSKKVYTQDRPWVRISITATATSLPWSRNSTNSVVVQGLVRKLR